MTLPTHTKEYLKEREPLLKELKASLEPHWQRYLNKEISHAEYGELIAPAWKVYSKKLEPHWIKAGGSKEK